MIFHLIATLAAGAGVAGAIFVVYRLVRKRPPRYLLPLAAGLAMLGYNVWSEYSWSSRAAGELPDHIVVVKEYPTRAVWQPWTYVIPQVGRFMAVDTTQLRVNDKLPGYVLAEVILVGRRSPTASTQQLFDCQGARRTDVVPEKGFDETGLPQDPDWMPVEADGKLLQTVCAKVSGETAD